MVTLTSLPVRRAAIALVLLILLVPQPAMAGLGGNTWTVPGDFATIQEAIDCDEVLPGDTILVGPGNFAGGTVTKGVHIRGRGQTVIDSGPEGPFGGTFGFYLPAGGDGASFSNLTFEVLLGIYARPANNVTIRNCRFLDNFQAITNWGGSNWRIFNNTITNIITVGEERPTYVGVGGTPIVLGGRIDDGAVAARHNLVVGNRINGEVLFDPADDGNEGNIWAIAVVADVGTEAISGNVFSYNQVSLVSNHPDVRQVAAVGLADFRGAETPAACEVIFNNMFTMNDFRGPDLQFEVNPEDLWDCNRMFMNW
jgi:hypothetical protein